MLCSTAFWDRLVIWISSVSFVFFILCYLNDFDVINVIIDFFRVSDLIVILKNEIVNETLNWMNIVGEVMYMV